MIDHVSVGVSDFDRSKAFYTAALATLGYGVVMEFPGGTGFGPADAPGFWISDANDPAAQGRDRAPGSAVGQHICFAAPSRSAVDAFHVAALSAGGTDNGKPGLRPDYSPTYYAAFVTDPDGYRIEAVCYLPE